MSRRFRWVLVLTVSMVAAHAADGRFAPPTYHPITPSRSGETVVLTGHDLSIEQVIQVARDGAKVALSPEARQRSADELAATFIRSNPAESFNPVTAPSRARAPRDRERYPARHRLVIANARMYCLAPAAVVAAIAIPFLSDQRLREPGLIDGVAHSGGIT